MNINRNFIAQLLKTVLFTFIIIAIPTKSSAQHFCTDAYIINSLPFNIYNVNTEFADIDTSLKYCGSALNHGNDTLFEYTPTTNEYIDIELSNPIISNDALVNIYLIDACTDESFNCIGSATGGVFIIENILLTANHTYYIIVTNTLWGVSSFIFDLEVRNHYGHDVGILEVNEPRSNCELSQNHEVSFDIKNFGNLPAYNFSVKTTVNGIDSIYLFTDTLQPGEVRINFPFERYDLSTNTENSIKGVVIYSIDENINNDSTYIIVNNLGWENSFPYLEDFETTAHKWVTEWDYYSNSYTSFKYGEPNASIINSASSGTNCFVTNLTGNTYSYEQSRLVGPCFDFSNLSIPVLEFDMWRVLDSTAIAFVEYNNTETDNWTRLGEVGSGENWYDPIYGQNNDSWISNTQEWVTSKIRLDFLANEPKVRFRFIYRNQTMNTPEGIAIDNIRIYEAPNRDIGITEILNPYSKCNINTDSITVTITNFSPDSSHSNFVIKAFIDDMYEFIDTVTQTVQANSSITYSFINQYNFNQHKEYKLKVKTYLINEDDITNDADSILFFNFDNNSLFPYSNDFETDNGIWYSTGINTSWEYGIPTDSVINSAASGTIIWATNLAGYHNTPEESFLTSSCFNLSTLTNPIIKFNANYDLFIEDGITSSYVQMQYSSDYGINWITLGVAGNNWYDAGYSWVEKSNNWIEKNTSLNTLVEFENIQFRFKLFAFEEKTGFAFDDFSICDAPKAGFEYTASGRDIIINDTSLNTNSYIWLVNGIQVSTEQNPTIIVDADSTSITQIVINDCYTDTITQTAYTSNINKLSNGNIKIYPNPTSNLLNIENNKYTIKSIKIISVTGKTMYSANSIKQNIISIDISNYSKALYLIRIETNNEYYSEILVVE